jgi:hypothetical protein
LTFFKGDTTMQYIPIHKDELLEVKCGATLGEETFDVTLIVMPICGSNEVKIMEIAANSDRKAYEIYDDYFNHMCKGYIANGERVMFKENEKPSDFFNYQIKKWLSENMYEINRLSIEQKKS